MKKRILRKEFFITLFYKQNNHHKHSVLVHTCKLFYFALKERHFKMLVAALLHDIGKPYIAYQDENDKLTGEYSFHNHEEVSYYIIKKWSFISEYTKELVRYHYLIRGLQKAKEREQMNKKKRLCKIWNSLDKKFQRDLKVFMRYDDMAKK